jgi:molybdopterin-biosynthesis enzyme MoeA-like protein
MGRVPQSSIIVIGNEIIRGFTVDTNSNWLAARLFKAGFPVRLMTTIGDVDGDIVDAVREHVARRELTRIFVCGGLGPTPDDRTYVGLARALDQPLIYRAEVGAQMQNLMFVMGRAAQRGTAELNAGNRRMAMLPRDAHLIRNGAGMAPGLAFDLGDGRFLFALPGVPHELRAVYDDIEAIYLLGGSGDTVRELHYRLAPESMFHDAMQALESQYPDVSVGSYPQTESRQLIIRASGRDPAQVDAVIRAIRERVRQYSPLPDPPPPSGEGS